MKANPTQPAQSAPNTPEDIIQGLLGMAKADYWTPLLTSYLVERRLSTTERQEHLYGVRRGLVMAAQAICEASPGYFVGTGSDPDVWLQGHQWSRIVAGRVVHDPTGKSCRRCGATR